MPQPQPNYIVSCFDTKNDLPIYHNEEVHAKTSTEARQKADRNQAIAIRAFNSERRRYVVTPIEG